MSRKADKVPEHRTAAGKHAGKIPSLTSVCTRQQRIAAIAQKYIGKPITTLHHHLDMLWMREAFKRLNPKSVAGIDEQSVREYAVELESNLGSLLERAKKGTYRAPPVKRKHIPKNEKETRPIGIPTTENKVLERAVVMLLEPIYEIDFMECSYGFRVKRSAHQALESIRSISHPASRISHLVPSHSTIAHDSGAAAPGRRTYQALRATSGTLRTVLWTMPMEGISPTIPMW